MRETIYVNFSDAAIKREAQGDEARELRDYNYPELRLRYRKNRKLGTWDTYCDGKWRKAFAYPRYDCRAMLAALPGVMELRRRDGQPDRMIGALYRVSDLLSWHLQRQLNSAALSRYRKATCKTAITKWLGPRLGAVVVADLNRALVDQMLIQPMQATLKVATVWKVYKVLISAIHRAQAMGLLVVNPLAAVKFSDFALGKCEPKEARLFSRDLEALVNKLVELFPTNPRDSMLALFMLGFGTRAGETRKARWSDFVCLETDSPLWVIPSETIKTGKRHELHLPPGAVALLRTYKETQKGKPSVFLFPGEHGQPLSDVAVSLIIKAMSDGTWSSHDLRKLARECWAHLGIDFHVGELLLNHAQSLLPATYIQSELVERKREALELWWSSGKDKHTGLNLSKRLALMSPDPDQ